MTDQTANGARRLVPLWAYLAALVAAILLPALGVGAVAVWTAVQGQRAAFERGLGDTASALALAVASEINTFRSAMATLAGSVALDGPEPDLATFDGEARRAAAVLGTPAVLLLDPATLRQRVNTVLPPGETPNFVSSDAYRRVVETGRPLVTDLLVAASTPRHVVGVAVPVLRAGEVRFILTARLEPTRMANLLAAQAREGSFATLIDGNNVVVARSRDQDRFVGQRVLDWIVASTTGREAGLLEGSNRLGEVSLSAFHRVAGAPGWTVVVGEPIAVRDAAVWRPVRALATGGLAVLALAVAAALGIGALVLRPVRDLTHQAEAVATGTGKAGAGPAGRPSRVSEFERLRRVAHQAEVALRAGDSRLRESEARLRAVVLGAPFPILLHAEDGEILDVSSAVEELTGWRAGRDFQAIGDWTELAYGERKGAVQAAIDRLYQLDRRVDEGDFRVRTRHDGERVWSFASAPVGRDDQGRRLVVSMAADVTDLRQAEAALARALAEQRAVYANAPAGLAAHDRDLRFIAVNAGLAAINGLPAEAHIGRTPREVLPGVADSVEPLIRRVLETGEPIPEVEIETETAAHPGVRRFYQASYYPVRDVESGELQGVSIAVLDIDARKRAEAALRELAATLERRVEERTQALSESIAELEAFAYTVSHDLRAPLRGMEGFAQALIEDYAEGLGPGGRRYAKRIAAAAKRMDELIGDLLEYSRLSRAEVTLRPVDLAAAVAGGLTDVGEAVERRGATVDVVTPMPAVLASPPMLRQMLANLLGNAVRFVPRDEVPKVRIWAERPSPAHPGRVRLWVEDNGIGIEPEHRERVFRVFERLHADSVYPGTGIGLAIVRRGAERMGGSAGVEDRRDGVRGSRFWVDLPASP